VHCVDQNLFFSQQNYESRIKYYYKNIEKYEFVLFVFLCVVGGREHVVGTNKCLRIRLMGSHVGMYDAIMMT